MFEMFTKENVQIVRPAKDRLVLVGLRNLITFEEEIPKAFVESENLAWDFIDEIKTLKTLDDVKESAKKLNPANDEGYVVCDHNFSRLKIKSPGYVALSGLSLKDQYNTNQRRMLAIVQINEGAEYGV
eukprot:TRINITY_DN2221_c0_g1_i1.p2 TRINITY_DN2221_c0_g1~~TRINITY_DN2221_c0_g1_i1.p2  ORF type:complete len:136 (-),score=30.36 TRINITY_DN2221_c0_g1_i1:429-812(-)